MDTLSADNNLLENDAAVQLISASKMQINELLEKVTVAKTTEKQIDATRLAYKALAAHATIIYFTISKLITRTAFKQTKEKKKQIIDIINFSFLFLVFICSRIDEHQSNVSI